MNKQTKILLIVGGAMVLITIAGRKKIKKAYMNMSNGEFISGLHPLIRTKVAAFLSLASQAGVPFRITQGYRSRDEQAADYAKGRTVPGTTVITNAKPGTSYHEYGLAFDIIPLDAKTGAGSYNSPNWQKIAAIGKKLGLSWGGDYRTLKDLPHFEMRYKNIGELQRLYALGKTTGGFVNIT